MIVLLFVSGPYFLLLLWEKRNILKNFLHYTGDEDKKIRANVIGALGKIGDKKSIDFLLDALEDKSWIVRYRAIQALGEMKVQKTIGYLEKYLKDPEVKVRIAAIKALGCFNSKKVVNSVLSTLKDPDWEVRYSAIGVLEKIAGKDVLPIIEEAFENEPNPTVKLSLEALLENVASPLPDNLTP